MDGTRELTRCDLEGGPPDQNRAAGAGDSASAHHTYSQDFCTLEPPSGSYTTRNSYAPGSP